MWAGIDEQQDEQNAGDDAHRVLEVRVRDLERSVNPSLGKHRHMSGRA